MQKPLVSVLIAAHDAHRTLGWALASVLAQTMDDWECIVVDDGSRQSLEPLVRAFGDARFRCIRLPENHGRGYARARALEAARGTLLAFLDADDWMYPTRLERQIACLRAHPAAALVGCSTLVEDLAHRVLGVHDAAERLLPALGRFPFSFASTMIRAEAARIIGFDPRLTRAEDVLFLTRAFEQPWESIASTEYVYRPSPPTRRGAIEACRCRDQVYALCEMRDAARARRLRLSYRVREIVHASLPERASLRLTTWARSRARRPATEPEIRAHREAVEAIQRWIDPILGRIPDTEGAPGR